MRFQHNRAGISLPSSAAIIFDTVIFAITSLVLSSAVPMCGIKAEKYLVVNIVLIIVNVEILYVLYIIHKN